MPLSSSLPFTTERLKGGESQMGIRIFCKVLWVLPTWPASMRGRLDLRLESLETEPEAWILVKWLVEGVLSGGGKWGKQGAGKELSKGEDSVGGEPQADSTGSSGVWSGPRSGPTLRQGVWLLGPHVSHWPLADLGVRGVTCQVRQLLVHRRAVSG